MWRGEATVQQYFECLSHGFCEKHLNEFGKVPSPEESSELQRKTMLYMRLCLLNPFLFEKSYESKTMKDLSSKCSSFPKEGYISRQKYAPGMKESIILFDSVTTYTLCILSKICCSAGLFKEAREGLDQDDDFSSFIQKIITARKLTSNEINNFVRTLKMNFEGYDGEFVKEANLMTLLFVRELRSLELTAALQQLEADLKDVPASDIWKYIGNDNYTSERYKEAISAYTSALDMHPYNYVIFSNRAQAHLKLNRYEEAELDSRASVMLCNTWTKGYIKLVTSLIAQNCREEAQLVADFAVKIFEHCLSSFEKLEGPEKKYFFKAIEKYKEQNEKSNRCNQVLKQETDMLEMDSDVPDLIDSSEDSENEVTEEIDSKELVNKKPSTDNKSLPDIKECLMNEEMTIEGIPSPPSTTVHPAVSAKEAELKKYEDILREGSAAIAEGRGHGAMGKYLIILNETKKSTSVLEYKNEDIVNIKYAYGSACIKSGTLEDLQKSITTFKDIVEKYPNIAYPAAFYGLGLAYYKMNRFKEALTYLDEVCNFVQKGINFKAFNWPGTDTVIEETKCDDLKVLIEELRTKCTNPPDPVGICCYATCLSNRAIFSSDPDFKGFLTILCSEKCNLRYHPGCWKAFKSVRHVSDKEYLNQPCITPDCQGVVIKVESTGKNGNIEKVFLSEEWDKKKSNTKQKKAKLKKKPNTKDQHPRKRQNSLTLSSSKSGTPVATENANEEIVVGTEELAPLQKVAEVQNAPFKTDGEPSFIIRKNNLDKEESVQKVPKMKDRKKSLKKNKLSVDEFCGGNFSYYNEYQLRLSKLQENKQLAENDHQCWANLCEIEKIPHLDPERPFHIPEELRNDPVILETILKSVDAPLQSDLTKTITENIYTFLEELLSYKGPLNINDKELVEELEVFPFEATTIIADNGGFRNFILKSMRFAVVADYVCVIDDVIKAYDLSSKDSQVKQFCDVEDLDYFENDIPLTKDEDSLSDLNPNAVEFQSFNHEEQISGDSDAGCLSSNNSNNSLLKVVNQLRQPISKEQVPDCKETAPNDSSDVISSNAVLDEQTDNLDADCAPSKNMLVCETSAISASETITSELQKLITWFYSGEFTEEDRRQINLTIKPYVLSKVHTRTHKCVQTSLLKVEKVSVETMKEDEELECTIERNINLTKENLALTEEKNLLEARLTSTLQSAIKTHNKLTNENGSLKDKLEELTLELKNIKQEYNEDKAHAENEQKQLKLLLDKTLEEKNVLKNYVEKINTKNKSHELHLKELESTVEDFEKEKQLFKTQDANSKQIIEQLKENLLQMEQKTHDAELNLLKTKKDEFSKRVDYKIREAKEKIKEIHTCMSSVQIHQPPFMAFFEKLLLEINRYVNNLANQQKEVEGEFCKSIKEVEKGAWLSDLQPIIIKDLEEIPSSDKILDSNAMPPYRLPPQASLPDHTPLMPKQASAEQNLPPQNGTLVAAQNGLGVLPMDVNAGSNLPVAKNFLISPLVGHPQSIPPGLHLKNLPSSNTVIVQNNPRASRYSSAPMQSDTLTSKTSAQDSAVANEVPTLKATCKESTVERLEKKMVQKPPKNLPDSLDTSEANTTNMSSNPATTELSHNISQDKLQNITNRNSEISGSSRSIASQKVETKNCYTKLLRKLLIHHPHLSHTTLMAYVSQFRKQNNNKLSGLSIDTIVARVGEMIACEEADYANKQGKTRPSVLINRKLTSPTEGAMQSMEATSKPTKAWAKADVSGWSQVSDEQQCSICFDEMTPKNVFRIDCGHRFHYKCIKEWLDKNSNCPICRVHVLLPDDYPTLT